MNKKVEYHANWMGPVNLKWIEKHGEGWASGRIDIYTSDNYPEEMSLPTMKATDWNTFRDWLSKFRTDSVWSLKELVEEYEKSHQPITWFKTPVWKING